MPIQEINRLQMPWKHQFQSGHRIAPAMFRVCATNRAILPVRGADRRPGAAAVQPGEHPLGRGAQRRATRLGKAGEVRLGPLDFAFLVKVRCHQPAVQREGVLGAGEDGAAVDGAQRALHAEPQAFEHGGEGARG